MTDDDFIFSLDTRYTMLSPGVEYRFFGRDVYFSGEDVVITRWDENWPNFKGDDWTSCEGFWCFPSRGAKITVLDTPEPTSTGRRGCDWCGK